MHAKRAIRLEKGSLHPLMIEAVGTKSPLRGGGSIIYVIIICNTIIIFTVKYIMYLYDQFKHNYFI